MSIIQKHDQADAQPRPTGADGWERHWEGGPFSARVIPAALAGPYVVRLV